jgi:hypothetical protein
MGAKMITWHQQTVVRQAPAKARDLLVDFRRKRAELNARWDLTPELKAKGLEILRADALDAFRRLRAEYDQAASIIRDRITADRRTPSKLDPTAQVAWSAFKEALDASPNPGVYAQQRLERAAARGERALLEAARTALPDLFEARGLEMPDTLADVLDLHGGPPEAAEAVQFQREIAPGLYRSNVALNWVEHELTHPEAAPVSVIPDFTDALLEVPEPVAEGGGSS